MRQQRQKLRYVLAAVGMGLLLTACGGSGDGGDAAAAGGDGGGGGSSSDSSGSAPTGDPILDFVQCLRDNGLDVPDPEPGGPISLGSGDPNDPAVQAAVENCRHILDSAGGDGGGGRVTMGEGPGMSSPEALLAFVDCIRDHGFDMPDPGADGHISLPENVDPSSPEFQAAGQECSQHLDGGLRIGDGSGGGPGVTTRGG